jgi:hypothetical protein
VRADEAPFARVCPGRAPRPGRRVGPGHQLEV